MATWLALGGVIALIGGALWLMWSPPGSHKVGQNDSASVGGTGHYGSSDTGSSDASGGDGGSP